MTRVKPTLAGLPRAAARMSRSRFMQAREIVRGIRFPPGGRFVSFTIPLRRKKTRVTNAETRDCKGS